MHAFAFSVNLCMLPIDSSLAVFIHGSYNEKAVYVIWTHVHSLFLSSDTLYWHLRCDPFSLPCSHPLPYIYLHKGALDPDHMLFLIVLAFYYLGKIFSSWDKSLFSLLTLVADIAIFSYLCNWINRSLKGRCFTPWEFWRVWLVDDVVFPIRLQPLSAL